jgi:hypothetical protein
MVILTLLHRSPAGVDESTLVRGGNVRVGSALVMVAVAVVAAACSEIESLVGSDEEADGRTIAVSADHPTIPPGGSTTIHFLVTGETVNPRRTAPRWRSRA